LKKGQLFHAPPVRKKRKEKKKKRKEKEKKRKRKRRREKKKRKEREREENAGAARSAGLGGQVHLAVRWPTGNFRLFLLFRDSRARG
jgi:transposase